MALASWRDALASRAGRHMALLHETPGFHRAVVTAWVAEALMNGHGAVLIGRAEMRAGIQRELRLLGVDAPRRIEAGQLVEMDAATTIDAHVHDGTLDRRTLLEGLRGAIASVRHACGRHDAEVRVWGEMVDILCCRGDAHLAREVEPLGNDVVRESRVQILCSYDKAHLASWSQALPAHDALLVEATDEPQRTAGQIARELFREPPVADPMALLLGRGAIALGGIPPRAFLLRLAPPTPLSGAAVTP